MKKGKYPYYIGGGLLVIYSLIMLINNIILIVKPDADITESWFRSFYILLPSLIIVFFILTVILKSRLFSMALRGYTLLVFFLCVGVNLALTAAAPETLRPMYDTLRAWIGIDIFALFGDGALWVIALSLFGCYLLWNLGFNLLDESYPAPYLISRTVSFSIVVFVLLPMLARFGWIDPPPSISKPLFVLLCGLYYLIFLFVRMLASTSKSDLHDHENWYKQMNTKGLIFSTVIMAILIVPYFKLIYMIPGIFTWLYGVVLSAWNFITVQWWRALIAVGVFVFLANTKTIVGGSSSGKSLSERQHAENERLSQRRIAEHNKNTYGK